MTDKQETIGTVAALLEGASNFRDFGGISAFGGARVKSGQLFRSNKLSALTDADLDRLAGWGVGTVFDLRLEDERRRDPTRFAPEGLKVRTWPPRKKRRLVDMALEYPPTPEGALTLMHDFYAKMPHTMAHVFGPILAEIASGCGPCIIHCSAGKDRTGVACALVLAALGASREDIVADYVRTREARGREADMARATVATGALSDLRNRYPPEAVAIVSDAAPSYIEAALRSIEDRYGSVDAYLIEGLELSGATLAALREGLLEA